MAGKHFEFTYETQKLFGITLHRIRATVDFTLKNGTKIKAGQIGGWIEKEENLQDNAWVYDNACVYENAQVYENACVYDNAQVYENACVYGNAQVFGNACVSDNACVYDNAQVYENACVYGNAHVYGNACVSDNALVLGNARMHGNARVFGNAHVYGNANVYNNATVFGNANVCGDDDLVTISNIGSRNSATTFFVDANGEIMVACGCFSGNIDAFRAKVVKTHGNNKHAKVYMAAADLAELKIKRRCEENSGGEQNDD